MRWVHNTGCYSTHKTDHDMKDSWDNEAMRALTKLPLHARRAVMAVEAHLFTEDVMRFYDV